MLGVNIYRKTYVHARFIILSSKFKLLISNQFLPQGQRNRTEFAHFGNIQKKKII